MKDKLILIFIFIVIFGLVILLIGSVMFFRLKNEPEMIFYPEKAILDKNSNTELKNKKNLILVDLSGAVVYPGPYRVNNGIYLYELINLAGGFSHLVDKENLNKNLSLVDEIKDNQKIYIPFKNDTLDIKDFNNGNYDRVLISINRVDLKDLTNLPGIGEVRAEEIIKNRPYQKIDDLVDKKIISEKLFSEIKNMISL